MNMHLVGCTWYNVKFWIKILELVAALPRLFPLYSGDFWWRFLFDEGWIIIGAMQVGWFENCSFAHLNRRFHQEILVVDGSEMPPAMESWLKTHLINKRKRHSICIVQYNTKITLRSSAKTVNLHHKSSLRLGWKGYHAISPTLTLRCGMVNEFQHFLKLQHAITFELDLQSNWQFQFFLLKLFEISISSIIITLIIIDGLFYGFRIWRIERIQGKSFRKLSNPVRDIL